jgi:hypothetical protein
MHHKFDQKLTNDQQAILSLTSEVNRLTGALEQRGQEVYYLRDLLRRAWTASEKPTPAEWNELLREVRAVLIKRDERDLNA